MSKRSFKLQTTSHSSSRRYPLHFVWPLARAILIQYISTSKPNEARARRDIQVARYNLQVPATLRAPEDDDARGARDAARHEELVAALRLIPEFHPADLVEPGEDLVDEDEALVRPALVDVLEDRDGVARRRLHPRVAVRDVDVGRRELERRLGNQHLRAGPQGAWGGARGDDRDSGKGGRGAVGLRRNGLHGERGGQLVDREQAVIY